MLTFVRFSFVLVLLVAQPLLAQINSSRLLSQMPEEIQRIRSLQAEFAQGLIYFEDEGKRSLTSLGGIPRHLRTKVVADEQDIIDLFQWLYPLYGFQRSEELRFESRAQRDDSSTHYTFREYINNIPTPHVLEVEVDNGLGIIISFTGGLALDRGFATTPNMAAADAIECAYVHVQQQRRGITIPVDEEYTTKVVYRWAEEDLVLYPVWEVSLAYDNRPPSQIYLINHENKIVTTAISTHSPPPVPANCPKNN